MLFTKLSLFRPRTRRTYIDVVKDVQGGTVIQPGDTMLFQANRLPSSLLQFPVYA